MEALIPREDVVVTVSHAGYIKRLPIDTYRSQGRGGRGIKGTESKEGDFIEHLFVANTHDYLMFFTNQGRVYERRVYDVPEMSRTSQGRSIANLLEFPAERENRERAGGEGFRLRRAVPDVRHRQGDGEEDRPRRVRQHPHQNGIIAIGLDDGDQLIGVEITAGCGRNPARHQEGPGDPVQRKRRPRHGPPGRRV